MPEVPHTKMLVFQAFTSLVASRVLISLTFLPFLSFPSFFFAILCSSRFKSGPGPSCNVRVPGPTLGRIVARERPQTKCNHLRGSCASHEPSGSFQA